MYPRSFNLSCCDTRDGSMFYYMLGEEHKDTVILLHQHPRSSYEFVHLAPYLAEYLRVISVDIIGFGSSTALQTHSIETYAQNLVDFIEKVTPQGTHVLGHHLGGLVAVETSALAPQYIHSRMLSCMPYMDKIERDKREQQARDVDSINWEHTGDYVKQLWESRRPYYSDDRLPLLDAFLSDALLHGQDYARGSMAARTFVAEDRIDIYRGPTLLIGAEQDPFSYSSFQRMLQAVPHAEAEIFEDGGFALPEEQPYD